MTIVENLLGLVDQGGFEYNDLLALQKIPNEIWQLLRNSQKQTKITDFLINKKMIIGIVNIL